MEKVNYQKISLITGLKTLSVMSILFFINNWPQVKQSFSGDIPPLNVWLEQAYTASNFIFMVLLSIFFFFKAYKEQKELIQSTKL